MRFAICHVRNSTPNRTKLKVLMCLFPLSGFVEVEKRIKDLSIYFLVETLQAIVYSLKAYYEVVDKQFDAKLNKVLYGTAVGCLLHFIVNHVS